MKSHTLSQTARIAGALLCLATLTAHADAVVETVHLVVTGGPSAGTWEGHRKFNSLLLIVPDAKKAAANSKEFFILFRFVPLIANGTEYTVKTRPT